MRRRDHGVAAREKDRIPFCGGIEDLPRESLDIVAVEQGHGFAFKLKHSKQKLDDGTKAAMQELYDKAVQHEDEYVWYTNWQIILKEENVSIGSACFKGEPDENGVVEIGYGLDEKYRGKRCGVIGSL